MNNQNRGSINENAADPPVKEEKTGMKKYFQQDDHIICCNVEESNCACIGKRGLLMIRVLLLAIMLTVAFFAFKYDFKLGFFFQESYWGFNISWISLLVSILAHFSPWF